MIDFRRMRWLISKLQRVQWDVEQKTANATRITTNITGMPRGGGGNRQETALIILADVLDAYQDTRNELEAMRSELRPLLDALPDPDEKAIMRLRYMDGYSPEEIPAMVKLSRASVYAHIKRAERKIRGGQNG